MIDVNLYHPPGSRRHVAHSRILRANKERFDHEVIILRKQYEDEAWADERLIQKFYDLAASKRIVYSC